MAAASVYLVYVLEILKFRRMDTLRLRRLRPEASAEEIERNVSYDLETGEFEALSPALPATEVPAAGADPGARAAAAPARLRVSRDRRAAGV